MKHYKVKGFTLIELLIVVATFSVIMFGALSLVQPVREIFQNSYRTEALSAGAQNIGDYFSSSLRYAEHIKITASEPDISALTEFIDNNYNGKLLPNGTSDMKGDPGYGYATGGLYVLKVDNTAGGRVYQRKYTYSAGDKKFETGTGYPADDIPSSVTPADAGSYVEVINKALYDTYHYNISLGIFQLGNEASATPHQLVEDTAYYESYDAATQNELRSFGGKNFGLTITAYNYDATKTPPVSSRTGTVSPFTYDPGYLFTTSIGLANCKDTNAYYSYKWKLDAGGNTVMETAKDADNVDHVLLNSSSLPTSRGFECELVTPAERVEPGVFYIIYSYSGEDVIT